MSSAYKTDKRSMVPLGLGVPVHRVPIITIIIVLACTVKYFANDIELNKNLERKQEANSKQIYASESFISLKFDFCNLKAPKNIDCKSFSKENHEKTNKKLQPNEILLANEFVMAIHSKSKEVTNSKHYIPFNKLVQKLESSLIPFYRESNLLTKETQDIENSFICMFTHGSISHLLGNMLTLIAFGIYVEVKIGALAMIVSYTLTGLVSFYAFVNLFSDSAIPLVGASGAIAGIMGMFYVSFYNHYLKFWLSFKTFLLPVKTYFPFLYILTDLLSHIEGTSNVASMAHIAGMITGMSLMVVLSKRFKTPHPFIYTEELHHYSKIKSKDLSKQDIVQTIKWLEKNPINYILREKLISNLWKKAETEKTMSNKDFESLRVNTRKLIGRSLFHKNGKSILKIFDLIPIKLSLKPFLDDFKNEELVKIYNFCLKHNADISAIRLACVLLDRQSDKNLNRTLVENVKLFSTCVESESLQLILNQCSNKSAKTEIINFINSKTRETA